MKMRVLAFAACLLFAAPAHAFTVASAFSHGCHEEITEAALRSVRVAFPTTAAPITPDENEQALVGDLPFDVPEDMRDLAAASLLVGVRDNDLKGGAPTDVDENAIIKLAREDRLLFGLDVFETEPLPENHPFRGLPNVTLLPHLGGPTTDRRRDVGAFALQNLRAYLSGSTLSGIVTPHIFDRST